MLYHLLYPLHEYLSVLNVFRYITFRCIGAALTAFFMVMLLGPPFIAWLKSRQIGQVVREDGPESHYSKSGVPTMGGMLILVAVAVTTLLWVDLGNLFVWLILAVLLWFGAIGAYDDWRKIRKNNSRGLGVRGKLLLQAAGAGAAVASLFWLPGFDGHLSFPFFKEFRPDLGAWYCLFALLVVVGASNAVNLTDGLDGLVTGPVVITGTVYLVFSYLAGHAVLASYLQIPHVPGAGEVAVFSGALVGACLGFLWFNTFPAQVFMGDTGSLAIGAALGMVAIITKQEFLLAMVGGIFVLEALSVILQVGFYKLSGGKRIFLMAPFHHHFEKKGWQEPKIVVRFWIISIVLGLLAIATLKLR
ncbi:phospho-N-acetylmuramoyl-pentapeptide-transferase [Desulfurivibrio alkaliphilus]|uniref:Phospho-N-acetylmuramoyl-pentapeptide-transferase n=1 Tax=Desulfurivibrio alkaliphilus (strain DSM 19089 / UNIQEM U267 / AHT2) TaxID=589865 RepID=D6Z3Q3_DESAT|nr:phospho-N-acetylmuramoyl-pentapeptide-transferase [Desulfurivibrio alkaliphilus]ADH86178.1 phospho-N-acetylmuramoyl-pentapeptide-transferase [Desulfurivibrio alkaliphilus AHT 2]